MVKNNPAKPQGSPLKDKIKNFDELKQQYELVEENLTLLGILRRQAETLEFYLKTIQQIMQPEEFYSIYECAAFDDKEKSRLFDLYKRLIITHREILKSEVMNEEKNSLATIRFAHEEIKSVKQDMVRILDLMKESWKREDKKDSVHYFG